MHKIVRIAFKTLAAAAFGLSIGSCIRNDIPYPTREMNFRTFEVYGALSVTIDSTLLEVTIDLADTVDIRKVTVKSYSTTEGTAITPEVPAVLDLSMPQAFTLSMWQDYLWTVKGTQTINRSFEIEGAVKPAAINADGYTAVAYVSKDMSLTALKIKSLVLGPSNATMTPAAPAVANFTQPMKFTVTYRDVVEEWTVLVQQIDQTVVTEAADGWVTLGWFKGIAPESADNGFEYRTASAEEWTKVDKAQITQSGTNFSAKVTGLSPATDYVCRAYSNADYGEEIAFTTDAVSALPDTSFDDWHKGGKAYCPWAEGGTSFWDTGNHGAVTIGEKWNISTPVDPRPGTTSASATPHAAQLESKYVAVKFAAGNIFSGTYLRTDGTDGVLGFGRPYTSRPTRLEGWYKYTSKAIDRTSAEKTDLKGRPDTCVIYVALTDWDAPLEIRTAKSNRQLFDPADPKVIAYGEILSGQSVTDWTKFSIELKYRATNRKPKYILVVGTASKYGDYFTGGTGSTLWIDDFELKFD